MKVKIISEYGYAESLLGLSLSHLSDPNNMEAVARRLAPIGHGHNKFLRGITVNLDISAPLYWWMQFATYGVGVTCQSESTMHTLTKRTVVRTDFENPIHITWQMLSDLEDARIGGDLVAMKTMLPSGFLQRRIVHTNYLALREIIIQRQSHKLAEWQMFCREVKQQALYPWAVETGT